MRSALFALAMLAAFSLCIAMPLEEFKAAYFSPNDTVVLKAMKAQGAYSLVIVNGQESG